MYALSHQIANLPVISLQVGEPVAWTRLPLIDMATFKIVAFRCEVAGSKEMILLAEDIRQLALDCLIINSEDELIQSSDLIRLQAIIEANYNPLHKTVISESEHKLGSVENYTINLATNRIQKIHVRQSLLMSWIGSSLDIDHSQIVDVTPDQIIVKEATVATSILQTEPLPEAPS